MPGGGCALPGLQPQITAGAGAAETAGAGGLNIAETFPEGRGSPHGCGLRAVFCRDAASARPEACRDKSKAPRSGDVAGRSPGVQGNLRLYRYSAGWRLRLTRPTRPAPTVCRPGKQRRRRAMASGTELRLCRVAAGALPGLQGLSGLERLNPQACRKIYPLRYSSRQLSTGQPYPAPAACSCGQGLTSRTRSACRHSGRSLMESV
ncbi:Uncharacterised protein [Klebsiella pneumoniae]|nr:Uncharacterised protein [Klebsiella pneumoniae]SWP54288.1 Uncharacterised protein [Klebsiella pneumoniae]SYU97654.1 Uncharacterised protein [Klebsiella pneumoniae]VAT65004.1 Uncharacterised protein [Klebsiella pneumoniae]